MQEQPPKFDVGAFYHEHIALRNQGKRIDAWNVCETVFNGMMLVLKERDEKIAELQKALDGTTTPVKHEDVS